MQDLIELLQDAVGPTVGRDASTLRTEEWQAIDDETVETIRRQVVARPLLAKYGMVKPLSDAGWTELKKYEASGRSAAVIDMDGEPAASDVRTLTPKTIKIPVIHAETQLAWRNLTASRHGREPLDVVNIADAAAEVALMEDTLLLLGDSTLGIDGLLAPTGKQTTAGGVWSTTPSAAYDAVNTAVGLIEAANLAGPRVLFVNATERKNLRKRFGTEGAQTPETLIVGSGLVSEVVTTQARAAGTATVVCMNRAYARGIFAQDPTTAELPPHGRNPRFSVWGATSFDSRKPATAVEIQSIT